MPNTWRISLIQPTLTNETRRTLRAGDGSTAEFSLKKVYSGDPRLNAKMCEAIFYNPYILISSFNQAVL